MNFDEEFQIVDYSYMPDTNILCNERHNIILKSIKDLPEKYKELILLKYDQDLQYSEIADKLGIPLGTVKVNLFRAKKMLELSLRKHPDVFDI
jgi:RNA polymerase sigma-70 factor (ECF subfamily)